MERNFVPDRTSLQGAGDMLRLTIIESPPEETPEGETWVVGPTGATLGRVKENTWTLTDSQSTISRMHCEVLCEGGEYVLLDTSSNGTFLDDSNEPIGRGQKAPLKDGSKIRMGGYVLQVSLETANNSATPVLGDRPDFLVKPTEEPQPEPDAIMDTGPPSAPLANEVSRPDSAVFEDIEPKLLSGNPFGPASGQDPLIPARTPAPPQASISTASPPGAEYVSTRDKVDSLLAGGPSPYENISPALPPEESGSITEQPAAIPSSLEPGFAQTQAPLPGSLANSQQESPTPSSAGIIPDDWYLNPDDVETESIPEPTPTPSEPPPAPVVKKVESEKVAKREPVDIEQRESQKEPDLDSRLKQALSGALGAHADSLSTRDLVRVVEELAAIVEKSTPALMRALASRTQFKDSLRLHQTMVRARGNNPLKPDVRLNPDQALKHMLLNDDPGFLNGRLAIEEAFRELAIHQAALIAALRPALLETIKRLSPENIQTMASLEGPMGFTLPKAKGKLWEAYLVIYAKMTDSGRGNLEQRFMRSLAQHYEMSLNKKE